MFNSPSLVLSNLWQKIPQTVKITFIATFIIGLLVHGYAFVNILLLSGDGLGLGAFNLNYDLPYTLTSGRWFQSFAFFLTGPTSTYFVRGIISLLYVAIASSIIVDCLDIKNTYSCVLTGMALVTFPCTAAIFSYLHIADAAYLSFLLACLSAFLCKKFNYGFIFGGVVLAFSLGIYQAYISFTAGLLVISLIHEVLSKNSDFKIVIIKSAKYFICLVLGLLLYYIILKIMLYLKNLSLTTYQGIDQTGVIHFSELSKLFKKAYMEFFYFFYKHQFLFIKPLLIKIIFVVFLTLMPIMLALIWSNNSNTQSIKVFKRNGINGLILIALVLAFPLALNAIYITSIKVVHLLVVYPLSLTYVLAISLMDRLDLLLVVNVKFNFKKYVSTFICWTLLAIFILVPYNYFIVINEAYFKGNIATRHLCQFSSVLLKDVRDLPDYQKGMQVVLFGTRSYASNSLMNQFKQTFGYVFEEHVLNPVLPDVNSAINCGNYSCFLRSVMGEDLNLFYPWDANFFDPYRDKLMQLAIYPSKGSMKVIDNKLFIRMG